MALLSRNVRIICKKASFTLQGNDIYHLLFLATQTLAFSDLSILSRVANTSNMAPTLIEPA